MKKHLIEFNIPKVWGLPNPLMTISAPLIHFRHSRRSEQDLPTQSWHYTLFQGLSRGAQTLIPIPAAFSPTWSSMHLWCSGDAS
jgi:hypothetical protein